MWRYVLRRQGGPESFFFVFHICYSPDYLVFKMASFVSQPQRFLRCDVTKIGTACRVFGSLFGIILKMGIDFRRGHASSDLGWAYFSQWLNIFIPAMSRELHWGFGTFCFRSLLVI